MNWQTKDKKLVKELEFVDFEEALAFVNRVAELAEAANHHPDILIHAYNQVKITIYTHDKDMITDKDYNLAEEIDNLD